MTKKLLLFSLITICTLSLSAQLTESFDGATFPPAGWTNTHSVGTDATAVWNRSVAGTTYGDDEGVTTLFVSPHSGAGMARFRSYFFTAGNGARLASSAFSLTTGGPHRVRFWMYRDQYYTASLDSISVYINTAQNVTGASFLGKLLRNRLSAPVEVADGWYEYSFNIPPSYNTAANYIIFSAVSDYGNNMVIDDVVVDAQPSCSPPTAPAISNYNYAAGTTSFTWSTSSSNPPSYEWAVSTSATPPASGTTIAAPPAAVTGITPNVVNYLYVRANCAANGFSAWASLPFAALPCATVTAPLNGATNVPQSQSFSWNAVTGATSYDFYLGASAGTEVNIGNLAGTSTTITNLTPNTSYSWYIVPRIGSIAAPRACASNSFSIGAEPNTPANNICSAAVNINSTNTVGNPVTGTTVNATLTLPGEVCAGGAGSADDDVWYQFTTTAGTPSGTITITPDAVGGIADIVAQVYASSNCGTLGAPVTCADATAGATAEVIDLAALAPSTHYFMRVYSYSNTTTVRGSFNIIISAGAAIPVTLDNFAVQRTGKVNVAAWSTSQEINTSHFVIERSTDGRNFTSIGQVAASGNSNTARNYSFTDISPVRGINYYRLKIIDRDNSFKYSWIRNVRNEGIADIAVYPNPVKDVLTVNIDADKSATGVMSITDISGKSILTKSISVIQGNNNLPVNVNSIAGGAYIIKVQLGDDLVIRKFTKL